MNVDLLIKNGHVLDPARGVDEIADVAVCGRRIVDAKENEISASRTVDASGCYVLPGLIDFHAHLDSDSSSLGAWPGFMAASGVTAAVDGGTCGCVNYPAFHNNIVAHSPLRLKSYLCCYSLGQGGAPFEENYDPLLFNKSGIARILDAYRGEVLGLKLRFSMPLINDTKPLEHAFEIAKEVGTHVCVHTTNPPIPTRELLSWFQKDDIFTHVFHGKGDTILDADGHVLPEIWEARERGVIFDMAHGNNHFSNSICQAAFAEGFFPDVITSDMSGEKLFYGIRCRSLPFVMNKVLSMGMKFYDVVRAVTATPARLMGMAGEIGTLAPGALADIAVMTLEERENASIDYSGDRYVCRWMLVPQMTILDGRTVFSQPWFSLYQ